MAEPSANISTNYDELLRTTVELRHDSVLYKQQYEEAQQKLDDFIKENAGLKAINSGLEQQLSNKNESLMKIDKERENFLADRMKFQKENTEMKTKKDYYELEVERLEREKRYLSDDVEMFKADSEKFKNKCTILRNQVNEFKIKNNILELEKEQSWQEIIEKERGDFLADRMKFQKENTEMKSKKDYYELEVERLKQEKKDLSEDVKVLKAESKKSKNKCTILQNQVDEFHSEKAMFASEKEKWVQDKELTMRSCEWYLKQLAISDSSVLELELKIKNLKKKYESAQKAVENMLQSQISLQLNTLKAQLDVITIERDDLQRSLDDSKVLMVQRFEELWEAKAYEALDKQNLKEILKQITDERDNLQRSLDNSQLSMQRVEVRLADEVEAKVRITIELRQQREEYSNLKEILKKMTDERDELQNKINTVEFVDTTTDGLTKEVQQLRNQNLSLEKQVTEQRTELKKLKVRIEAKEKELVKIVDTANFTKRTAKRQNAAEKRGPSIDPYSPRDPVAPGTSKRPRIVYNMPEEPEPTPEQVQARLIAEKDIEPDEGLENEHALKNGNEYFPSMEQRNDQLEIHDEEMEDMPVEPSDENFAAPSDGEINDPGCQDEE